MAEPPVADVAAAEAVEVAEAEAVNTELTEAQEADAVVPEHAAVGLVLRLESALGEPVNFAVAGSGATLGRAPENQIRLDDLSVSRRHARIAYRQRAYWLSDAGSVGGTWVDGTKLDAPRRLAEGQVIDVGMCRLTVLAAPSPTAATARARPSHR